MTTWTPQPGTLNHRAIEYLKTLPAGKWVASGPFAQAIDSDSATLSAYLVTAVRHGAVLREKRNGLAWWALGDGSAARASAPSSEEDDPKRRKAPALDMDSIHRIAEKNNQFSGAVPEPEDEPREPDAPAPDAPEPAPLAEAHPPAAEAAIPAPSVPEPPPQEFQFSWCSNREITLSKDGGTVVLTPRERDELARFIDAIQIFEAMRP